MNEQEEKLHKARQQWVVAESTVVEPKFTVVKIAEKTGYSKGAVSNYLSGRGYMSLEFIKTFCEKYGYDFNVVNAALGENMIGGIVEAQAANLATKSLNNTSKDKSVDNQPPSDKDALNWLSLNEKIMMLKEQEHLSRAVADLSHSNKELVTMQRELHREMMAFFKSQRKEGRDPLSKAS